MQAFRTLPGRMPWSRLARRLVLPVVAIIAVGWAGQASSAAVHPLPGSSARPDLSGAAARARAEAKAFTAKSRLTTGELIRAARRAGNRLGVHTRPPVPRDIRVHPPIVVFHPQANRTSATPHSRGAAGAVPRPAGPIVLTSTTPLSGQVTSPQNEGQTSTIFTLQAQLTGGCGSPCSATTYHGVTFQYRVGTSGSFANIPTSAVSNGGAAVTWPVTTSGLADGSGVNTPALTWLANRTIAASGLLQIQARFTAGLGDSYTTSPVTVTLDVTGNGGDFATAQVGPTLVGLQSGNMSLSATDVLISGYGMGLSVSRTFNSLAPGTSSVFGPGWTSSLPVPGSSMQWSSVSDDGSYAVLTDSSGNAYTFAAGTPANGVTPYTAQGSASAQGLTLAKSGSGFTLTDQGGGQVQFTAANSNTPNSYKPSLVSLPGASQSVGYIYDATASDSSYGDPLLMVGPNANLAPGSSVTSACPYPPSSSTWTNGCRALKFSYNTRGDLTQVDFVYQQSGTLTDVPVADYGYDSSDRLTQEWNPLFTPNLVTSYTYDETQTDANYGRMLSYSPAQSSAGSLAPWNFTYNTTSTSADYGKLTSVSRTHSTGGTATQTLDYSVPLTTAAGGPLNMDAATVGTWNQTDVPASAVAVFPATHVPSSPPAASDWPYAQIIYYDTNGMEVNTANHGSGAWDIATTQYDGFGDVISQLSAADRVEALAAGASSALVAAELETVTNYTQSADGAELISHSYGPLHNASVPGQGTQEVRDESHYLYDQNAPAGGPFDLVTEESDKAAIGSAIPPGSEADVRITDYVYSSGTDNIGWTIRQPLQVIQSPASGTGLKITKTTAYNENSSLYGGEPLPTQTCMPSDTSCSAAGTTKYVYYTGGSNPVDSSCGGHAMWAGLVCKTLPAAQPGTTGLPSLPVTTYTYNVYDQPLTKTETFGSSARTATYTYNALREPFTTTITTSGSGMGTAIPKMENLYSPTTGLLTTQETLDASGNVLAKVKYGYDDFGEMNSYTDAAGNLTSYGYNLAGQVASRNDGQGTVTIGYNSAGLPNAETDSQAGSLTGAYNPDGSLASETYPGGLTASYGYDETGGATSLAYAGEAWGSPLTDSVVPDAHADWASQAITDTGQSLASSQAYSYDKDGRLSSVQDTERGQCTTRAYAYDLDSNRTSLTTYAPGTGGACQSTTGTSKISSYDSADRLTNSGYSYDTQGDITTTPSADAGGNGSLTATYYANNMLASQAQNGQTITWQLDPTAKRFTSFVQNGVTHTNHYSDSGNNVTWVSGSDASWKRYITDLNGLLCAQITASGVTLELPDLHGDILATASTSGTATGPTATNVYNEFGQPESGSPGTYGWLGGNEISGNALGGQLLMGARAFNPGTGRFSQVDPVPGGSANAYDYTLQNPVTNTDLTGLWNWQGLWCQSVASYRAYRFCVFYIDEYWTREIEFFLELGIYLAVACGVLNPELMVACTWLGFAAGVARAFIVHYDRGGGIYVKYYQWRAVWWWFGWQHGRWHIYWAWIGGQ